MWMNIGGESQKRMRREGRGGGRGVSWKQGDGESREDERRGTRREEKRWDGRKGARGKEEGEN